MWNKIKSCSLLVKFVVSCAYVLLLIIIGQWDQRTFPSMLKITLISTAIELFLIRKAVTAFN